MHIPLVKGGIATSGDSHRFIWHQGVKLSHILNPHTGWPVTGGPSTVTVFAHNCTQAGMLATFALLHGSGAEEFLPSKIALIYSVNCRRPVGPTAPEPSI